MAGQPKWRQAEEWLKLNPEANARQLRDAIGCAASTAQSFIRKWRYRNQVDESKVATDLMKLRKARVPVEDLPGLTRESVIEEMKRLHRNIKALSERLERENEEMLPSHLAQTTGAIQNLVKAAQILGDSYPGLAGLVSHGDHQESGPVMADDLAAADEWLGLVS